MPSAFDFGTLLKYSSLVVLVVQNCSQVLLIRYARTRQKQEMFFATTAVFWSEVVKLFTCIAIVSWQERSFMRCATQMYRQIVGQPLDTAKVCVPSLIYTIQNNLLYVAVSHLAAATFMVTYQLKILTTALFSVSMLRRPLSRAQWSALMILFVGVSIVQLAGNSEHKSSTSTTTTTRSQFDEFNQTAARAAAKQANALRQQRQQNPLLGLGAVVVACLMSGFSGIYFEKILKGSEISVWMRNIQLAVLSVPISFLTMQMKDGTAIAAKGMQYGYDGVVWAIIILYAVGGLTVAVVIKYADNILKGFATSVSIVVSCVVSVYIFDFSPTALFIVGTVLVMLSVYIYSKYPYSAAKFPSVTGSNGSSSRLAGIIQVQR